jgi:hypothetical protein
MDHTGLSKTRGSRARPRLTDYRPTHVPNQTWESIAAVARTAVSYSAMTEQTARRHLSHISPYAAWAYHEGVSLNLSQLMEASTIERYIEIGMPEARRACGRRADRS